jgi:hypothetical protein
MNTFRFAAVSLFILLFLFLFAIPKPEIEQELKNADLPWNITLHDDGSTEVFGLRFGKNTLADAIERFQEPEDIAIYLGESKRSLEVYFGTVNIGPLEAKLVLTLAAEPEAISAMLDRARGRSMSGSEDRKIQLAGEDKQLALEKRFSGITFIPNYSGLDSDFFKQRFGEPDAWLRLNENAVEYFYPGKGLRITIDAEGKEILQYSHPREFVIPEEAQLNTVSG